MPEEKRSTIEFMPEKKRSTLLNNIDTREMLYAGKMLISNLDPITYFRQSSGLYLSILFFMPPMVHISVFWRIEPKIAF